MTTFIMPALRYAENALEPIISKETVSFHYGKHLQTYVNNLNKLVKDTEFSDSSLEEVAAKSQGAIANNSGQVLNHTLYFEQFSTKPSCSEPSGALSEVINKSFGSFNAMKAKMIDSASTLFGSGWAWLCADNSGNLSVHQMPNADNPIRHGLKPLLTFDVWEHAYYLDYQNRRNDYLNALWDIIDWDVVAKRFEK